MSPAVVITAGAVTFRLSRRCVFKSAARTTYPLLQVLGVVQAILSSYPQETLLEETEHHGIQGLFLDIVGSAHDKVSAMATLMERNGFLASSTAYIGDMVYDVRVGKIARVTTIALFWGYQPRSRLLSAEPDFVLADLREIKKIIS